MFFTDSCLVLWKSTSDGVDLQQALECVRVSRARTVDVDRRRNVGRDGCRAQHADERRLRREEIAG